MAAVTGIIAERIASGALPRYRKHQLFGGKGDGHPCSCCGETISPAQVQYDVELTDRDTVVLLTMHRECFGMWEEQSR